MLVGTLLVYALAGGPVEWAYVPAVLGIPTVVTVVALMVHMPSTSHQRRVRAERRATTRDRMRDLNERPHRPPHLRPPMGWWMFFVEVTRNDHEVVARLVRACEPSPHKRVEFVLVRELKFAWDADIAPATEAVHELDLEAAYRESLSLREFRDCQPGQDAGEAARCETEDGADTRARQDAEELATVLSSRNAVVNADDPPANIAPDAARDAATLASGRETARPLDIARVLTEIEAVREAVTKAQAKTWTPGLAGGAPKDGVGTEIAAAQQALDRCISTVEGAGDAGLSAQEKSRVLSLLAQVSTGVAELDALVAEQERERWSNLNDPDSPRR